MNENVTSRPLIHSVSLEWMMTLVILTVYVVWILSLKSFPSQDGPAHRYFVFVMHALLSHTDPVLSRFYRIKHVLPPYSLYYYTLMLLSRFVPFLLADKLVIATYFVSFVFGFRFLARSIGPGADRATLLATILLMNWPLGMGFVNYCLSLSITFWALGLWFRLLRERGFRLRAAFVLLAIVILLTHPVPLLVMLGVCGLSLVAQFVQSRHAKKLGELPPPLVANVATFTAASLCLAYIKLFVNPAPNQQASHGSKSFLAETINRARIFYRGTGLDPLTNLDHSMFIYLKGLTLILIAALAVAVCQRWKNHNRRVFTHGDLFFVLSLLLMVALPLLPPVLNGSSFFAERLLIWIWVFALLAASGSFLSSTNSRVSADYEIETVGSHGAPRISPLAVSLVLLVFIVSLHLTFLPRVDRVLRPLGDIISAVDAASIGHKSQSGLILDQRDWSLPYDGPAWDPYYWAAADIFRRNDDVLINPPWLTLAIIPLGYTSTSQGDSLDPQIGDTPNKLWNLLKHSPKDRDRLLTDANFVILLSKDRVSQPEVDPVLALDVAHPWTCRLGAAVWYQICDRAVTAATLENTKLAVLPGG